MAPSVAHACVTTGIITLNPDLVALGKLIETLSHEPGKIVVIDNCSENRSDISRLLAQQGEGELIQNSTNLGVATAVNQLATMAEADGSRYIIPFDQDSMPEKGIQGKLYRLFEKAQADGRNPAAIGPVRVDPRTGEREPFIRFKLPLNRRIAGGPVNTAVDCDFLITSGCLMSIEALDRVGMMEESLFVDNVDLEWSFRARSKGYCLLGATHVTMWHRIGDATVKFPWLRTPVRFHAPLRTYFVARNRLRLYGRSYVPASWKIQDVFRFFLKMLLLFTVAPERKDHFRYFSQGVRDSLRGDTAPKTV